MNGTTYTDTPLLSDTTYNYDVVSIDKTGNRGIKTSISYKTQKPSIVWHVTSPNMIDGDNNTSYVPSSQEIVT